MGKLCKDIAAVAAAMAVAAASSWHVWRIIKDEEEEEMTRKKNMEKEMKKLEGQFEMSVEKLKKVVEKMSEEMEKGLSKQDNSAEIKMLITCFDTSLIEPLRGLSRGESICVYALDLGGTNVRALRAKLFRKVNEDEHLELVIEEDGVPVVKVVPTEYKTGTLTELFDFLAGAVKELIDKEEIVDDGKAKELGFCFSFPVTNTAINAGTLTNWTKDYNIDVPEGTELVPELNKALLRKGLKVKVGALVNDTVGTLAIGHLNDAHCLAGVIFGTGTNAAYIEDVNNIHKGENLAHDSTKNRKMVINMEWGNFNPPEEVLMTEYDRFVDSELSDNEGKQIFEKMISGKYLGKIVGQVLLKLANETGLFGGSVSKKLKDKCKNLGTDVVNEMHSDPYLAGEELKVGNLCRYESKIVAKVCKLVVKRAARLSAAAIVAILTHLKKDTLNEQDGVHRPTAIAIDGSLYEKYGKFRKYLKEALEDILGEDFNKIVTLKKVKDGSGLGAAIIAASARYNGTQPDS